MSCERDWVDIFKALLTPTIALFGVIISLLQWLANVAKRKNELFDKRYEFYNRIKDAWLSTASPEGQGFDIVDLVPIAEEAYFLFGDDVSKHIISLAGKIHNGSPFFPDSDFTKPFEKYLRLK